MKEMYVNPHIIVREELNRTITNQQHYYGETLIYLCIWCIRMSLPKFLTAVLKWHDALGKQKILDLTWSLAITMPSLAG